MSEELDQYPGEATGSPSMDVPSTVPKFASEGEPHDKESTAPLSSLESLQECAQQLIDEINAKRQRDATILSELKAELENHTRSSLENIEKFILDKSQAVGDVIQRKLQVLYNTLSRVEKMKVELEQFKMDLGVLNSDIQIPGVV